MKKIIIFILFVSWLWPLNLLEAAMSSNNYQIWADVVSVGGIEQGSSTNYRLRETLGEAGIGRSSSTNYSARIGFREMEGHDQPTNQSLTLNLGASAVSLGILSETEARTASHSLEVGTNSNLGVSVAFTGNTLTCSACVSNNTIAAIGATAVASAVGTSQFGFNVAYQSGVAPVASAVAPYNNLSQYALNSGDQIISASGGINNTIFSVVYLANISGTEAAGSYVASITYTATANF